MNIPLVDLKAQYLSIKGEIDRAVAKVLESQRFILGPEVEECERQVAEYCRCMHGCGVSSGTDALLLALMCEGIGPGDEVVTTPFTFFATAGCVARLGARPVFADIDPVTYNIDPADVEKRITPKTKAVIPVHLFGQVADMGPLLQTAKKHGLAVIEDCAQAIGAESKGRRAGSFGDYGCISFFPSKNLGGYGDGGMVVTRDPGRAERLKILRTHGASPKYYHHLVGGNFRLDALQAAVIHTKIRHLEDWTERRIANAGAYGRALRESGLVDSGTVGLPHVKEGRHVFHQYVIRVRRREELRKFLEARGIASEVYYPVPLHLQKCFAGLGYSEWDFPHSEKAAQEALALPIFPELTGEQIQYVATGIREFFR